MDTNQVNTDASIAVKLFHGVRIFFDIRWFMENTEGSHVKTAIRYSRIPATFKDIYERIMLGLAAMHALNVERPLQQARGLSNTLISIVVLNHSDARFATKAIPSFQIFVDIKECMQIVACRLNAVSVDKRLARLPVFPSIEDFVIRLPRHTLH